MIMKTPWTEEQVQKLNEYQQKGQFHPFTCGNGSHVLRATTDGWVCDECEKEGKSWKQDWCHSWMAEE